MNTKVEQSPAINRNLVLSVVKDGTVIYSNEASEPLLQEWGVEVGRKLPSIIGDLVQRVISMSSPEKIEVKAGDKVFLVIFSPLPGQECVNISGFDISDQKELEVKLLESEALEIANVELSEILDIQAVKPLMEDLYKLVHIPIGINDLKGNVLVSVGWQDICAKFHRIHPETLKHCVESDSKLSSGVVHGEFKLYKCKNNMYDIVTPILVSSQHVGYVFGGQFFFDDEPLDYELFRSQAKRYGFNEEEYIDALKKVPQLSRKDVEAGMSFFMTFANLLSQLNYSYIKLAKSLSERDTFLETLRKSESKYRHIIETAQEGVWIIDRNDRTVFVNQKVANMLGYSIDEILGQSPQKFMAPEFRTVADDRLREHRQRVRQAIDYRFIRKDGSDLWCIVSTNQLFDDEGKYAGSLGMLTDVTKRKRTQEALQESESKYRQIIETANEGVWVFNSVSETTYVNDKMAEMLGYSREEMVGSFIWDYADEEDKDFFQDRLANRNQGIDEVYECKLIRKNDFPVWLLVSANTSFDKDGKFAGSLGMFTDITERKKAEEALKKAHDTLEEKVKERTAELEEAYKSLKESEEGLAEAQRMTHIGNGCWDLVTGEIYWSDEIYRIFGLNPQESTPVYSKLLNYVHPDDREHVDKAFQKGLRGESFGIDHRIILDDERERIVHTQIEVILDEKNIPIRMMGTVQDITEHKKAEEKIQILADAVESSNDAIVTRSLDDIVIGWNKGAEKIHGYSAEEVLGKHISILEPDSHRGETTRFSEMIKQGKTIQQYETSRLRKDGTIITVSLTLSPVFSASGKLIAISAIARDVTESKRAEEKLRESEEKYRNIVETANEGIALLDREGIITYLNKKMEDMLGYSSEEMLGRPAWDFVAPEDVIISKSQIEKRRLGASESYEIKLNRKDGSSLWVLINAKSIFDDDGKYIGSLSMHTDITKRKEAEKALSNIEIARKKEIHHRIKNNLQVISSLLDLQAEQFNNREYIKDSEVLEAFKESQNRVISMALIHEELHKSEGFESLNFSSYVKELADNLLLTYRLGNYDINLNMDLDQNVFLDMDTAVPLGIIINELVSNSLKHAFPDRNDGKILIKLHRVEGSDTSFILTVSDNGVGIPENIDIEDLDSLGLQLVVSLVDQLDGELELKRDNGTEFTIRFTVTEKDNQASEPAPQLIE